MSINCWLSRSRSQHRWSPGPQSQAAPSLATYLSALCPALHLTRGGHNTLHQSLTCIQHLSSLDESGQDPERARMENLNYLLSKVFDGWRMATNKVLITEPSPSLQCPLVSPSPGHLPIINGVRLVTRLLLLLAAANKEDKCQCLSSRVPASAVSASL